MLLDVSECLPRQKTALATTMCRSIYRERLMCKQVRFLCAVQKLMKSFVSMDLATSVYLQSSSCPVVSVMFVERNESVCGE